MAIDAVAAAGATSPTVTVDADVLRSVTLAQMIGNRMSTELAGALSTAGTGIGALGLSQAPMITLSGSDSSTKVPDVNRRSARRKTSRRCRWTGSRRSTRSSTSPTTRCW
jgi:hypothetical protein